MDPELAAIAATLPPTDVSDPVAMRARLREMATLDPGEPETSGRLHIEVGGRRYQLAVNVVATVGGTSAVVHTPWVLPAPWPSPPSRPRPGPGLGRVGFGLINVSSLLVLVYAGYVIADRSFATPRVVALHSGTSPSAPQSVQVGMAFFVFWVMSLNLALPGLLVGIVAIAQSGDQRILRCLGLVALVVGGAIAEIAATGVDGSPRFVPGHHFLTDDRFGALLMCLVAVFVIAGSALFDEERYANELRKQAGKIGSARVRFAGHVSDVARIYF